VLEIPEGASYDGYEFKVFTYVPGSESTESGYSQIRNYSPIVAEEENGEAINDAVYKRNRTVEEKLNIKFSSIIAAKGQMTPTIVKEVQAGDTAYDVAFQMIRAAQNTGTEGYLVKINDIDTVHLEKDWWDKAIQEGAAINGALYAATSDATIEDKEGLLVMFYNEKVSEDHGMEDIYKTINDGKWTFDDMLERCAMVTKDINGDGVINQHDACGTGTNFSWAITHLNGFGMRYAYLKDGEPVSGFEDEKMITAIERIAKFMNDTTYTVLSTIEGGWGTYTKMFMDNRMLIRCGGFYNTPAFREMDSEFSIIPLPKYDENQEEYHSGTSPHASYGFVIPVTNPDLDRTGVVMETMSYYSTDTVLSAYVDITLEGKIARNEESIAMMHKIIDSAFYDIGYVYNWAGIEKVLQNSIKGGDSQFVSAYAGVRDQYLSEMAATYELYK